MIRSLADNDSDGVFVLPDARTPTITGNVRSRTEITLHVQPGASVELAAAYPHNTSTRVRVTLTSDASDWIVTRSLEYEPPDTMVVTSDR